MATSNINIRIDEKTKMELQELLSKLGLDMTSFFVLAAKQAVREQGLPFLPRLKTSYPLEAYEIARKNTKYNEAGEAVISSDDEWLEESEWDEIFSSMKKEKDKK